MPYLFIILLKINLVLLLFAATYYLVLRRLTFYILNRCFLVLGIVFSTAYPFIDLTEFFHQREVVAYLPELNQKASALVPTGFFINNWPILSALFYLGVLFMTVRLSIQFISLYKIHKKSNPNTVANYKVRTLDESVSPFSFWQTIYVNPSLHNEKELDTILAHEMVHVKQWHSVDIILAELSVVFYWFNPGVWLMKKAVKENLEFITDQKILKKGMDRKAYQYSLLGVGQLNNSVAIVNNFNISDLKKRIQMMNLKRSSRLTLSRYALALPVLLATTLAFTVSKKEIKTNLPQLVKIIPQLADSDEKPKEVAPVVKAKRTKISAKTQETKIKVDTVFEMREVVNAIFIKRDSGAIGKLTASELAAMMAAMKERVGSFTDVNNPITNGKVNKMVIYRQNGVDTAKMAEAKKIAITFKATAKFEDDKPLQTDKAKMVTIKAFKFGDNTTHDQIEYVVNGKVSRVNDIKNLNPNEIEQINVIKGSENKPQMRIEMKKRAEL
ncbi:M56 family metallopeptidase [Pedobacter sp. SL55]|uniref:M56 family metallopeptidase n=1 Tax=Pedobacter sp. SL55 TaxID=2995161 RepID=UPI002270F63A|nr:M56 family metallopeptidase [Pedobacter sp. SL55]WAC40531.1 M56 family metallopeptidase [Pedobacter sp. SL55]